MTRFANIYTYVGALLIFALALGSIAGGCAKPSPAPSPTPTKPSVATSVPATTPAKPPASTPKPAATPSPSPTAKAVSAEEFFKNNTISLIVPSGAGGGPDIVARLFTAHWPDVAGGGMKVLNKPEGGGYPAVNEVYAAKPDGLTLGLAPLGSHILGPTAAKAPAMKFEAGKFKYIGLLGEEGRVFGIGAKLPYKSVAELQKAKGLKFGGMGKTSAITMSVALFCYLFQLDAKVVTGFDSSAEIAVLVTRGELDGVQTSGGTMKGYADKGWMKPVLAFEDKRNPLFPDLVATPEVIKLSPEDEALKEAFNGVYDVGRVVFGPPGLSEDKLQFLRASFDKMMNLQGFKKLATSQFGVFEPPLTGKQLTARVDKVLTQLGGVAKLNQLVEKYAK